MVTVEKSDEIGIGWVDRVDLDGHDDDVGVLKSVGTFVDFQHVYNLGMS